MPVLIGVDPGLVHTGIVTLEYYIQPIRDTVHAVVAYHVVEGMLDVTGKVDPAATARAILDVVQANENWNLVDRMFVEKYRDRGNNYGTDSKMRELESSLRREVHALRKGSQIFQLVDNTGSKQVIRPKLLKLLEMWKFPQATHHQDLEAAARILVYGMLKDPEYNSHLVQCVEAHLAGNSWNVRVMHP